MIHWTLERVNKRMAPLLWTTVCLLPNVAASRSPLDFDGRSSMQQGNGVQRIAREETLIFNEEFKDFNLDLWKHEITMGGGGNWEFQVYGNNRTNSYVEGGKLFLQPTLTSDYLGKDQVSGVLPTTFDIWGLVPADLCTSNMFYGCSRTSDAAARHAINPVMSARVRTAGTFSFRYGRVEVKAKLPKGDWLWPAIWLLPEHNAYGQWPASGEIDIMESRGNAPSYGASNPDIGGIDTSSSALHWGPHFLMDSWEMTNGLNRLDKGTFNDDFHIFGLYWDENQLYTYVDTDDNRVMSVDFGVGTGEEGLWKKGMFDKRYPGVQNPWKGGKASAPYDQRFYLVMNVAVGGVSGFFPDGLGDKMWHNSDSDSFMKFFEATPQWFDTWNGKESALQVEYVKVWQTKTDYFFAPGAATAVAATEAELSLTDGGRDEIADSTNEGMNGLSTAFLIVVSTLFGMLLGGFAVMVVLSVRASRQRLGMYESIGRSNDDSNPAVQSTG